MNWIIYCVGVVVVGLYICYIIRNNKKERNRLDKIDKEKERLKNLNIQQYYKGR